VNSVGSVFSDGAYNCGLSSGCFNAGVGADVAERIDAVEALEAGDVVEIDARTPGRFRRARHRASTLVAGVLSASPAVTLNNNDLADNDSGERSDQRPLLALVGQVPVKASTENGPIHPGSLLVSASTPGHAMAAGSHPELGTVIGKALGSLETGRGTVQMLVMLR
jgi:hypothetical protein